MTLQNKKVVVLGISPQAKALGHWLPTQGASVILADQRDMGQLADDIMDFLLEPNVRFALGGYPVELLDDTNLLCLTDGIPSDLPLVQYALGEGVPIANDATLFMEYCPAKIVGIAGTIGKTTTAMLLAAMCKEAGMQTWVGTSRTLLDSISEIKPSDCVILELNSFQLEIATASPPLAALLNVVPTYLDRYSTLEMYGNVLSNVFMHQTEQDLVVYGRDDLLATTFTNQAPGERTAFSATTLVTDGACFAGRRLIVTGRSSPTGMAKVICERDDIQLLGPHNLHNIAAACALAGVMGVSPDAIREVLLTFNGLPHRLETVGVINDVTWINDSIATSPDRVIPSLRSFDQRLILLIGGPNTYTAWDDVARLAAEKCSEIICFGESGSHIEGQIKYFRRYASTNQLRHIQTVKTLPKAIELAARIATKGDVVLFSPGTKPENIYVDYEERGEHFRELVKVLQDKHT